MSKPRMLLSACTNWRVVPTTKGWSLQKRLGGEWFPHNTDKDFEKVLEHARNRGVNLGDAKTPQTA